MICESVWIFCMACGTTSGSPSSCLPRMLSDCATLSKST
ncbi:Uncharacterised protein [Mycobacteroides abscessus subsp. abscessus]|nr:Uncharacterised protein [Mycobacteroides abscessus subsp. abscessus]